MELRGHVRNAREKQNWAKSEAALTEALEIQPDDEQLLSERSAVFLRQRKITKAIQDAEQLVSINPASAKGYSQVAVGLTYRQEYPQAAEALVTALELNPTDTSSASLLDDVLTSIRRQRSYWHMPAVKPNPTFDKMLETGVPAATATRPPKPKPPKSTTTGFNTIRLAWTLVDDDGGDECFQYEVMYSAVDPITQENHRWSYAYRGIRKFVVVLSDLLPETEYVFKLRAVNTVGASLWSDFARSTTEKLPEDYRRAVTDIPESWHALEPSLIDVCQRISPDAPAEDTWRNAVTVLRQHVAVLKQCFRIYTLSGMVDDNPIDISLTQYRRFLEDLRLSGAKFPKAEMDNIFLRSNVATAAVEQQQQQQHEGQLCEGDNELVMGSSRRKGGGVESSKKFGQGLSPGAISPNSSQAVGSPTQGGSLEPSPDTVAGQQTAASSPMEYMSLDAAFGDTDEGRSPRRSLLKPSDEGYTTGEHTGEGADEATEGSGELVRSHAEQDRTSVVSKKADHLSQNRFVSAVIRIAVYRAVTLGTEASGCRSMAMAIEQLVQDHIIPFANLNLDDEFSERLRERKVRWVLEKWREKMAYPFTVYATIDDEGSTSLLNLRELLCMMREANLIEADGPCTEHQLKTFFALVNMADELFEAAGGQQVSNNSLELTLDEFLEVCARVGNAYLSSTANTNSDATSEVVLSTTAGQSEDAEPLSCTMPEQEKPFEVRFDNWLSTWCYPALEEASKRKVIEECAASPNKKARMNTKLKLIKKTLQVEVIEVEDAEAYQYSDPNKSVINC